ncbi:SusC/RagA family TonB-linked outer membrane protein [Mucilaginibacter segetis]|uniref:SusC/RagA family TonB-linked outer membrane protein n=1 Tax=Mucilaginibacter segetis TaxID=2793071 RepID=A0A934PRP8_9SPHI|nr:SusC/RagA family TonB-linked outer membrane protein [Mucilaginibacter segetis]MBK0378407.1 SusC/RagA family TonB-linked outer membrane protein [Mucilaginibacter segetis]
MQFKHLLTLCFFALSCLFIEPALAQNKVITGKVTDKKDGSPLIGVSVVTTVGGSDGTVTDVDGNYRLSVPAAATTLTFTYIGYDRVTVNIDGRTSINVSMQSTSTALNEVVVVGYGSQRVKDATGSVSSLNTKDFNKGVISTPEQLLQGRVAGVQVTPASGEPGAGASINIRGTSSIRAGNNPLYVIDGVPLDNGGTSGGFNSAAGSSAARNPLSFLNPADIENISILKDASSEAIYGSRGANGVILITTKKGRKGQGIQFGASTSIANTAKRYDLLSRDQFLTAVAATGADAAAVDFGANTDWQDEIFRTGVTQNYNLGFGGGTDKSNYRASFSYDDQNGTVKTTGLKRLTGRLNATQSLFNDFIKLDLNFLASNVKNRYALITDNAGFQGSLIGAALQANPTYPVYNSDGTYFSPGGSFRNPVALLNGIDDRDNINRYLTNLTATVNFTKNLSYKASLGYDYSKGLRKTFFDPAVPGFTDATGYRNFNIDPSTGNGRAVYQNSKLMNVTVEHTLTYDKRWSDNSQLTVLGGYSYYNYKNYGVNEVGFGLTSADNYVKDINSFKNHLPYPTGDSTRTELQSYFGRVFYSYKDRYLVTATLRTDGSSKFGANNKYATFPALSFKWKIMNESFGPKNTFDDLSIRLNYGKTGNQEFPAYSSIAVQQTIYNNTTNVINPASPNLRWETTEAYGAGIDFALLKGRLSGSIDYFDKSTKDLLFYQDYAQPAAFSRRWVNLPGTVKNRGVELGLDYQAVQGNKFTWEVAYNMTLLKNKMTNFGNGNVITGNIDGQGLSGAYSQVITNNEPLFSFKIGTFSGFDANGFNNNPGAIDVAKIYGSAIPTFTAGLTNNFSYGSFNASIFINGSSGFYIYNNTANAYFIKGNLVSGRNVTQEVANSNENPLNSGEVSTRFLEKGDFIRLSNVTLGYTFTMPATSKIKTLRLSLTGQNLALITGYSGLDPEINTNKARNEVPSRGIDYTSYPSARTFTLGLNAGF